MGSALAELGSVRCHGSQEDLMMVATANLGESEVRHRGQFGVVARLPAIRGFGLIAEFLKPAKSQLCPAPSNRLFDKLAQINLVRQGAV
jgi:hypothetical protein